MLHEHERSLVKQYEGRPFVILGVSNDPDPGLLRATQKSQQISWRSWWDEGHKITEDWGVEGFPTLFLIDAQGKEQKTFKGLPKEAVLDKEIEKWVKAAEQAP